MWSIRTSHAVVSATVLVLVAAPAIGHPGDVHNDGIVDSGVEAAHQHGGDEGHLPPSSDNVDLIGQLDVEPPEGGIADVAVKGDYAYLAAWQPYCPNAGTIVVDISDPANPTQVAFMRHHKNSYTGEGQQVIHVDTRYFNGDLHFSNNEPCDGGVKPFDGGANIWNVTDPTHPIVVARGVGDWDRIDPRVEHPANTANSSHSVFAWDAGAKAYMVQVDNIELTDVDIFDITQPHAPKMIAEYDLDATFPQIVQSDLGTANSWFHDVVVKQIDGRWIMLASYWDGGYVLLDVTDPKNASYVGDSDFTNPDPEAAESGLLVKPEGNAHQAEFSGDNDYIVAADEDFNPYALVATNTTDNSSFEAILGDNTPAIEPDEPLSGDTVFVGRACPGDAVPAAPTTPSGDQIALIERGVCTFTEKLATVEAAGGYEGAIVFNREGFDGCTDLLFMSVDGGIPAAFVGRQVGWDLLDIPGFSDEACRTNSQPTPASYTVGTIGDAVRLSSEFDGWGYVHLFQNGSGKLTELDTYAVPEAHDPDYAEGFGDLSVHEVAMSLTDNTLAYFSYYAAGFRVAAIENNELVERGHYIAEDGNNFWGVQVFSHDGEEYVAASDRDHGLWIFQYTGP